MRDLPRSESSFSQLITKMPHVKRSFTKLDRFYQDLDIIFRFIALFVIMGYIIFCIPLLITIVWENVLAKYLTRMKGFIVTSFRDEQKPTTGKLVDGLCANCLNPESSKAEKVITPLADTHFAPNA